MEELRFLRVTFLLFFFYFFSFWVIGWRYLENSIHHRIKIRLLFSDSRIQLFVDGVKSSWIYLGGDRGVSFGPILKNFLKVRAPLDGFFHSLLIFVVEVMFDGVARNQEVENDSFII